MRGIFLALAFCVSLGIGATSAFAVDFDGTWDGQGELKVDNVRTPVDCDTVEFDIIQTNTRIELRGGRALCERYTFIYPRMRFAIDDGIIYDGNIAVGMAGEGYAHFVFSVREGNLNVIDLRTSALGMQFTHTQSDWGRTGTVLRASLARDN